MCAPNSPATEPECHGTGVCLRLVSNGLHEALGVERHRVRVRLRIMQHAPDVRDDNRAFGKEVSLMHVVLGQTVRDSCARA